jgi:transcription termination/antitermination protein NusG
MNPEENPIEEPREDALPMAEAPAPADDVAPVEPVAAQPSAEVEPPVESAPIEAAVAQPSAEVEPPVEVVPEPVVAVEPAVIEPAVVEPAVVEAPQGRPMSEPTLAQSLAALIGEPEPVVDADLADAVSPDVAVVAPIEASDEEESLDLLSKPRAKKKTTKAKSDAPKAPRKPSRKKEKLPDLGDGTGYIAPDDADMSGEEAPWFAVHCYSGQENKVKTNLEQRIDTMGMAGKILKVVVPTEDEIEVRDGKRKTVKRQVYPGYVLVQMQMSEDSWFVVRNTPGVTRFVGMGNRPQPLSQAEVNTLLGRMEAEAPKIRVNYRTGQKVRITDGPFADFIGVVDKIDTERAKVVALVSFFGRETPVELDFLQVEKT